MALTRLEKLIAFHDALVMERDKRQREYQSLLHNGFQHPCGLPGGDLICCQGPGSAPTELSVLVGIRKIQKQILSIGEDIRFAQQLSECLDANVLLATQSGSAYGVPYNDDGDYEQTREIVGNLNKPRKPRARPSRKAKERDAADA